MTKRGVGAGVRVSGVAQIGSRRRRGRGALLLSSALGCSLLVAGPSFADPISQEGDGDVVIEATSASSTADLTPAVNASGANVSISIDEATTEGDGSPGVYVGTATGDVTVDAGSITTAGGPISVNGTTYISAGVAVVDGEDVSITSNQITTSGGGGFGITVVGVGSATVDSGQITTTGNAATGITVDGVTGPISITSDSISTSGESVVYDGEIIAAEAIYATGDGPITIDSGLVTTEGQFAHGILVEGAVGDVNVTSGQLSTTGDSAQGILVQTTTGDITINAGTTTTSGDYIGDPAVNPYGYFPDAITAITGSGDISITSESASADGLYATAVGAVATGGGDVLVHSGSASGAGNGGVVLQVDATAGPDSNVAVYSDSIVNDGDGKGSLVALGTGDVLVDSGSIVSTGTEFYDAARDTTLYSAGLTARSFQGDLVVNSGSVSTAGDLARGIVATADTGSVTVTSESVTTQSARGIQVRAAGDITIDSGSVHAAVPSGGAGAHGIMVTAGAGDVNLTSDEIVTEGAGSHGIYVANAGGADIAGIGSWRAATGGTGTLTIDSGSIDASGWGMMIDHQGAIDITSDTITSAGPGIYLYGGDAVAIDSGSIETTNGTGIVVWGDDGAVDITSGHVLIGAGGDVGVFAKTISGDITINAGDTTTTATGLLFGSYTADAVGAVSTTGDISITSGSTSTVGVYSSGIFGITGGDLSITSGSIENAGDNGNGILANAEGSTTIDSGSIHTTGDHNIGMIVDAGGGDVSITSDDVTTEGAGSHAIYIANAGGADIAGIGSWRAATGGTGALTIDSGSITSSGWGMMIDHQGAIDITSDTLTSAGPGIYLYGGDAVTIDSGSIETTNGTGIVVWGDDGAVDITSGHVLIGEGGDIGVFAKTTSGDITINAGDTTTTAAGLLFGSYTADAVGAVSDTGNINITSGSTSTQGLYSSGVFALTGGDVSITSTAIENSGVNANGIYSRADGDITVDSGAISVTGDGGWGLYVNVGGSATVVSDSIVSTGVSTEDQDALGMAVGADGDISITSGLISTVGDRAFGIGASAGGAVTITSEDVTTQGETAAGIAVIGAADVSITSSNVTTAGHDAVGIAVSASGLIDINVTGDVNVAQSWGVAVESDTDSAIDIGVGPGASIYGSEGAITVESDNDATLTVYGHLSSDADTTVRLAGGDDVANLMTGANIEGALSGGAGIDTLNLNSTVNDGAGIGQSVDSVVDFEALNVTDGRWTIGGDLAMDTTLTGGTLVITGSLTDDVVVGQNAALQIGDGGATGALVGDLQIDGTAIFDRSDEYDFGGDVSGTGTLVKQGDAGLILSGAYNFTGTTKVEGGTIKIINLPDTAEIVVDDGVLDLTGTDQELASLSGGSGGTVDVDGGSLTVNQDGSTEFAGEITGDGSLTLSGGGTLNLTGDNTYTGPTTVDDGLLKVNGSVTSDVTVDDGGSLGGSGTIGGDVAVGEGGMVGPGNSPGTLTVAGDFTFASGSTYVAEVRPTGEHDLINVGGATTIADDVTLSIMAGNGDYARLSTYTILHSVGGITGEFSNIETNLAFLDPHLTYTASDVVLALVRNDVTFSSFAANANQVRVANAIEGAGYGDALYDALVVQSAEGSRQAYNALSGEIYAGLGSVLIQQNRYGHELVLDRAATASEGRGAWGQLLGGDLKFDGSSDYAAIDSDARGLLAGVDTGVGPWRTGVAVSYLTSDVDSATLASKADLKSTAISGYVGRDVGNLTASIGASYSHHDIETNRSVMFPSFSDAPKADFQAHGFDLFGEVSVRQQLASLTVEPFLAVSYETLHVDGFTEAGGEAALTFASSDREVSTAQLGVRLSTSIDTAVGRLTPYASVALRGVSGDDEQLLAAAFQNGAAYAVAGAPIDDGAVYDVGLRLESGRVNFKASYSGMNTDRWSDQQGRVGLSVRF